VPREQLQPATRVQFREGASNWVDTPFLQATTHKHEHERRTPVRNRVKAGSTRPSKKLQKGLFHSLLL
jgi:hypothetical protein